MRRQMPSVRKYLVTGYQHRALQSLLPPEDLNVSQWAEKYRMLDSKTSADVLDLLKRTGRQFSQTIVMITHNDEIARLADRIVRIEDGRIAG